MASALASTTVSDRTCFFEAIRIIKEMRDVTNGRYPTFAVWENVPGAFSSNKGADFRCVLEAFVRISAEISVPRPANGRWNPAGEIVGDGFSVAWRQLDAQYWGVPQRRKRIYLVADFRGGRAGEILFERESMRGHPAACGATGQGAAADATGSAGGSRDIECVNPWAICFKAGQGAKARSVGASEKVTPTLGSEAGGNSIPAICFKERAGCPGDGKGILADNDGIAFTLSTQPDQSVRYPQVARTLTTGNGTPCIDRGQNVVCYDARGNGDGTHCPTLTGDHENRVTDYTAACCITGDGTAHAEIDMDKSGTLRARHPNTIGINDRSQRKYIIRRMTPLECCRLQGFPDGWGVPDHKDRLSNEELEFWQGVRDTCASIAGKPPKKYSTKSLTRWYNALHTDTAEYKMWGNGIALPCAAFVLGNVANVIRENVE